ncbi:MAG TPA: TetR/AcrR family transcriptional regulator [Myxococcota bacterium]|nr:TetR/AcrR family transcriptional regulator [Myxococcota bacterium]HND30536.1 TetR/AcrR family transcriptional regulator [Myxococcota bacterium]
MESATRTEDTRALLLRSALLCFAEHGFEGTSIRKIATRAGLSLGLLYHYFPSKEALLQALFAQSVELIQGCFLEVAEEQDPRRRLELLLRVSFRVMKEHRDFYRVSYGVRMQPGVVAGLSEQILLWNTALHDQFLELLEAAAVPDASTRAFLLISALDGACQQYVLHPDFFPLDAVGELLLRDLSLPPVDHEPSASC